MQVNDQTINQVEQLSEMISKFGPVIVVIGVFLLLFMIIVLALLTSKLKQEKEVQQQNNQLVQALIDELADVKKATQQAKDDEDKSYDEKNIVELFVKLNRTFKQDCKKYAEKTNCDRIGIYVFHNGSTSSHGLPFFKVSCICEWLKRGCGISGHLADSTNIPLNIFDDIIDRLYSYGTVVVQNTGHLDNPRFMSSDSFYLDKDQATVAIFVAVYDSDDKILAFIMGEFLNILDLPTIDETINSYKEFCSKIKPVLEFSDYQKLHS